MRLSGHWGSEELVESEAGFGDEIDSDEEDGEVDEAEEALVGDSFDDPESAECPEGDER